MVTTSSDAVAVRAVELARKGADASSVDELVHLAGGDREALVAARDEMAARLHRRSDDWEATAALTLLNRSLAQAPRVDPLDWRERWARHRKP